MATYTSLSEGQAPAFGTSGQAVSNLQTQLNTQNAGKAGYTPLTVDGKYGPLTQAATTFKPTSQLIVTGSKPASIFAQNQQDLANIVNTKSTAPVPQNPSIPAGWDPQTYANFKAANPNLEPTPEDTAKMQSTGGSSNLSGYSDSYTQALDRIASTSDKATQNLVATIKANKANQANTINDQYDRLKDGLFSLGVSTGQIQFTPDLVYGKQIQADNARTAKLQDLDQKEATALIQAQTASDNKDFTVLKEKMAYLKTIKDQRLKTLQDTFTTLNDEAKIGKLQASKIYDHLQSLPQDQKLPFLQEVAKQSGIDLMTLTSQVKALATKNNKSSGKGSTAGKNNLISNIQKIFGNTTKDKNGYSVRGDDQFIDPQAYLAAYKAWTGKGYAAKAFRTQFPAKSYVNPASYSLLPPELK